MDGSRYLPHITSYDYDSPISGEPWQACVAECWWMGGWLPHITCCDRVAPISGEGLPPVLCCAFVVGAASVLTSVLTCPRHDATRVLLSCSACLSQRRATTASRASAATASTLCVGREAGRRWGGRRGSSQEAQATAWSAAPPPQQQAPRCAHLQLRFGSSSSNACSNACPQTPAIQRCHQTLTYPPTP